MALVETTVLKIEGERRFKERKRRGCGAGARLSNRERPSGMHDSRAHATRCAGTRWSRAAGEGSERGREMGRRMGAERLGRVWRRRQ
jgi:hypothetical protein